MTKESQKTIFSIIVITYNAEKYVLETLESIHAQTYPHLELIISDDCSSDSTVDLCQGWIDKHGSRFENALIIKSDVNTGISGNCNRGINRANGTWIKIIAGDDLLVHEAFDIYHDEILKDLKNEKDVYHGRDQDLIDGQLYKDTSEEHGSPELQNFNQKETTAEEQYKILLRFCPVSAPTTLIRKSIIDLVGPFDERFKFWEDRPMWLKLTSNGIKMHFINAKIAIYRRHSNSVQEIDSTTLFSRTVLSMDAGYKELIIPQLPFYERFLLQYLILVRGWFYRIFNNKKTPIINIFYKSLVYLVEKELLRVKRKYKP
jgi:glycosyltransferase involved in cell wall biosynthesis